MQKVTLKTSTVNRAIAIGATLPINTAYTIYSNNLMLQVWSASSPIGAICANVNKHVSNGRYDYIGYIVLKP